MARYSGTVYDTRGVVLPEALVLVRISSNGELASLTDDNGNAFKNPLSSDKLGAFYFNVDADLYDISYLYGGRIVREQWGVAVGDSLSGNQFGASLVLTSDGETVENEIRSKVDRKPTNAYHIVSDGAQKALNGVLSHFYDTRAKAIRPFNGGGSTLGLIDYVTAAPAYWIMESIANTLFNDWKYNHSQVSRQRIADNWAYSQTVSSWTTARLAGFPSSTTDYNIVRTLDDGVWLCINLMHVHEATGDNTALGLLVEAVANISRRFNDTDTTHNPPITFVAETPNFPNINYGLGNTTDPVSGVSHYKGGAFTASTNGNLYCLTTDTANMAQYGKIGATVEAGLGICSLYVYEKTGISGYLEYAKHIFAVCKAIAKTVPPNTFPYPRADGIGPQPPTDPLKRVAGGIYWCQWCLNYGGGTVADPDCPYLYPDSGFYGQPLRNLDATYLGGATMVGVLGARLYRELNDASYKAEAVSIANAIINPQAYGRTVGGVRLIQNTRDPNSEGHWMAAFAEEVLSLSGVSTIAQQAFTNTGNYIVFSCVNADGYISADWGGPEDPGVGPGAGTTLWQQTYDASPGSFAGRQQACVSGESLAMLQAAAIVEAWGVVDASTGVVPVPTPTIVDTILSRLNRLEEEVQSPYDATGDILDARLAPGYAGDTAALNAALAQHNWVTFRSEIGGFVANATIVLPPNTWLVGNGQLTPIIRTSTLTGPTIVSGASDGSIRAGSIVLDNLWFVHVGRLGYTGGALPNLVTSGASHIEIYGGQAIRILNCGGYGMPYWLSLFFCGGAYIQNPFIFGGVWNPLLPSAQEGVAQIRIASSPIAHNVNIEIVSPEMYGGNTLGVQPRTVGSNTVQARLHCGPLDGILVESGECVNVTGGFVGGYANTAVAVLASHTYDILLRVAFNGVWIDESNNTLVLATSFGSTYPQLDGLLMHGCDFNGQVIATNGIYLDNPSGVRPVRRVKITSCNFRAFLGSPLILAGVDNADIVDCEMAGYNLANNTSPNFSSGIYAAGNANDIHIRNCQFGGGQNFYTEGNTVDPTSGLTPNGCMYGVYGGSGGTGDYAYLRARNLAKTGGSLVTGTLTQATA